MVNDKKLEGGLNHNNRYDNASVCTLDSASWVIKSPKGIGEIHVYCFCSVSYYDSISFSFRPNFVRTSSQCVTIGTGRIVLKFGDMVNMDVMLCKRVSKFKMLGLKRRDCADFFLTG